MTGTEGTVAVTLLGGVSLRRDGMPIRVASTRAVALLGYLVASAPAAQPRAHLAGLFWPDTADTQARTNLRRELHQLRQIVPSRGARRHGQCDRLARHRPVRGRRPQRSSRGRRGAADLAASDTTTRSTPTSPSRPGSRSTATPAAFLPGAYDDWALEARDSLLRHASSCATTSSTTWPRRPGGGHRAGPATHPARAARGDRVPAADGPAGGGPGPSRRPTTYHRCAAILEEQLGVAPTVATSALLTSIIELDRRAGRRRNSVGHRERRALRTRPRARRPRTRRGGRGEPLARGLRRSARHVAADGGPRRRQEPAGFRAGPDRVRRGGRASPKAGCFSASNLALAPRRRLAALR